jgi:hypothetical protein
MEKSLFGFQLRENNVEFVSQVKPSTNSLQFGALVQNVFGCLSHRRFNRDFGVGD